MKRSSSTASILIGVFVSVVLLWSAPLARATVYTVTNGTDTPTTGTLTLRQAIAVAADGDEVSFNLPAGTAINLTQGELDVNHSITITGPGANVLTVEADPSMQGQFDIFSLDNGPGPTVVQIHISGLSISRGARGVGIYGGIVTLTLTGCPRSPTTVPGIWRRHLRGGPYT